MVYVPSSLMSTKFHEFFICFYFFTKFVFLRESVNVSDVSRCIAMYRELNLLYFNKIMTDSDYSMT